jgi:hypothetical protein
MGLYQRVRTSEHVPTTGATFEGATFEMKGGGINKADDGEMAKDVAAFANAAGGVIVVGVDHNNGTAQRCPLERDDAGELVELYSAAVGDRCSPRPFMEPFVIDVGPEPGRSPDKRFVVAVNVWPYPDQPVGVTYSVMGKRGLPSDIGEAFKFPLRVGAHTRFLRPEKIPMFLSSEIRRMAILIDQIPASERSSVEILSRFYDQSATQGRENAFRRVTIVEVDPMKNCVRCQFQSSDRRELIVPLDSVAKVWKSGKTWTIAVRGQFALVDGVWDYQIPNFVPVG